MKMRTLSKLISGTKAEKVVLYTFICLLGTIVLISAFR